MHEGGSAAIGANPRVGSSFEGFLDEQGMLVHGLKKAWPVLRGDEAERFVAEADRTEYDFAQMVPVQFELRRKDKAVSLRLSDALLEAVKRQAARQVISYQRFMRQAIEHAVASKKVT